MTIRFTITGNQEDRTGNPIPYFRRNSQNKFSRGAKRYHAWEGFVRTEYWLQTANRLKADKPFGKQIKARLEAKISFRGELHADPDNIAKGLLDALFEDDKHVDVSTAHSCGHRAGSVEVTITTHETHPA